MNAAVIVAAGRGTRMGLERNKVLVPLCGEPVIARTVGDYTYTDNSDGTVTITNYGGSERNLTIPEELDGKTVSAIGYAAFAECRSLESVVVPETVTRL